MIVFEDYGVFGRIDDDIIGCLESKRKYRIFPSRRVAPIGYMTDDEFNYLKNLIETDGNDWFGEAGIYFDTITGLFEWDY